MVRTDRYKLIVGTGRRRRHDGYANGQPPTGPYQRLFDLKNDPDENDDLAAQPTLHPIRDQVLHALHDRLIHSREGLDPIPAGLTLNETIDWCLSQRDGPRD